MKVLFLDIDGVLNSDRSITALKMVDHGLGYRINYLISKADPIAVKLLNQITDLTKAKICVSSANRKAMPFDRLVATLQTMGVTGQIIDKTPSLYGLRGDEIELWLEGREDIESYVIIDDATDFLPHQLENFVRINGEVGITRNNALKAQQILGVKVSSLILP